MIKYTCNCDWFELMLIGEIPGFNFDKEEYRFDRERIALVKREKASKHFKIAYEVIMDGRPFGNLLAKPRNEAIMPGGFMQFQVNNNILYEVGWLDDVRHLFKYFGWEVRNVTRADIALDGTGFMETFNRYHMGELEKIGKASTSLYRTGNKDVTGFDIGRRSSSKMVTSYYKCREIEKSNKHYIKDMWDKANLDQSKDVERIELRLRNEAIKLIKDFDWTRLDDFEYLASVMRTGFENFCEFVKAGADSNLSRRKRIEFIDWDEIGGALLPTCSTKQTSEFYRLKLTAKSLYWIHLATGEDRYLKTCTEIVMNLNCLNWFLDKRKFWGAEYRSKPLDYIPVYRMYKGGEQLKLHAIDVPTHAGE